MLFSRTFRPILSLKRSCITDFAKARRNFSMHDATEMLSTLHTMSGLPWWLFIPATTFALRAMVTLPIAIIQRRGLQKQNELRPIAKAMAPVFRLKLAQAAQDAQTKRDILIKANSNKQFTPNPLAELDAQKIAILTARERMKRQKSLFKKYGVQSYKFMLLPLIQIPLWVSMSFTYRSITGWGELGSHVVPISQGGTFDPTLAHETFLHINDMALADPYFIAPIILGMTVLMNAEWNFKTAQLMNWTQSKQQQLGQIHRPRVFDVIMTLSRAGLIFLTAVSTQAPVALVWYWICSNLFSLVQNVLLDKYLPLKFIPESRFRRWGNVPADAKPIFKE